MVAQKIFYKWSQISTSVEVEGRCNKLNLILDSDTSLFFRGSERYIQGVVIVGGWRRQIHLACSRWYTFNLLTSFWIESLTARENFLNGGASSSMRKTKFWLSSVNSLCFSVFWKWVVDDDVNDILASRRRRRNLVSLKVRFGPFWLFKNGLNWQEICLIWISY